jgi:3-oxoacyl-[acyl-carrier protein] reductase
MLKDKTAIVTGGSRGIGAAVSKALAERGANVAILYAGNEAAAEKTVQECEAFGVQAKAWQCNVAEEEAVKAVVGEIRKTFDHIDILVNNAGITKDGLVLMMKESAFNDVIDVNLRGAFHMIRQTAPLMVRGKFGRIVNVSSVSGLMGNAGQANYSASKAGLIGLTKSVARELAGRGITCNAVAPGFISTDMTAGFNEEEGLAGTIPLGRMGKPEEVAAAIVFLLESDYITGEVLRVDGGLAM